MKWQLTAMAGALSVCAGCDLTFRADSGGGGGRQSPLVQTETVSELAKPADQPGSSPAQAASQQTAPIPASGATPKGTPAPSDGTAQSNLKPAEVGLGAKGQGYGGGVVSEPIRIRFRAAERISLDLVEYNLKLFQAQEGRFPQSHEEFMEKIIQAGQIQLPELPAGQNYVYDPETHELMIEGAK